MHFLMAIFANIYTFVIFLSLLALPLPSESQGSVSRSLPVSQFVYFRSGDVSPTESLHSLIDLDNLTNLSIDLPDMYVY